MPPKKFTNCLIMNEIEKNANEREILPWRRLRDEFSREFEDKQALQENKEAPQQKKEAPQKILEAPQHFLEAPETQGKRTWAEISADANQGNTVANRRWWRWWRWRGDVKASNELYFNIFHWFLCAIRKTLYFCRQYRGSEQNPLNHISKWKNYS